MCKQRNKQYANLYNIKKQKITSNSVVSQGITIKNSIKQVIACSWRIYLITVLLVDTIEKLLLEAIDHIESVSKKKPITAPLNLRK